MCLLILVLLLGFGLDPFVLCWFAGFGGFDAGVLPDLIVGLALRVSWGW